MYGIDTSDRHLMRSRSWRWLRTRIEELFSIPPVLLVVGDKVLTIPQTRIGYTLAPPGKE